MFGWNQFRLRRYSLLPRPWELHDELHLHCPARRSFGVAPPLKQHVLLLWPTRTPNGPLAPSEHRPTLLPIGLHDEALVALCLRLRAPRSATSSTPLGGCQTWPASRAALLRRQPAARVHVAQLAHTPKRSQASERERLVSGMADRCKH